MYLSPLFEAFRKWLPADLHPVVMPPGLGSDEMASAYPADVYTPVVVAELVSALELAAAGERLPLGFCPENSYDDYDALAERREAADEVCELLGLPGVGGERRDPTGFSYVTFDACEGYFHIEIGGCNVQSGVDVYAWREVSDPPCRPA